MKSDIFHIFIVTLSILFDVSGNEIRTWTSKKGDAVQASFVKESAGMISLKKVDNTIMKIKREMLSDLDKFHLDQILNPPKENIIYLKLDIDKLYYPFNPELEQAKNSLKKEIDYNKGKIDHAYKRRELESRIAKLSKKTKINSYDSITFKFADSHGNMNKDSTWKIISVTELPKTLRATEFTDKSVKTSGRFIKITFSIKNITNFAAYLITPKIKDSEDRVYSLISGSNYYINKDEIDINRLKVKPGFSVDATGIYEIASESKDLKAMLSTFRTRYNKPVYWIEIPMHPIVNNNLKK